MSKQILVVDDEKEIGILLETAVANYEIEIVHLYNGNDALAYLKNHTPDLILLDIQLPEMNGLDILQEIRQQNKESIVVMITAFATVETAVVAMKKGATDFLCKPFSLDDLKRIVDLYLIGQAKSNSEKAPIVTLEEVERKHIKAVLESNNGNRKKTANDLGISLRTLYYKIKQYDLE